LASAARISSNASKAAVTPSCSPSAAKSSATFFEGEKHDTVIRDLFTEKSSILDDLADDEVDLASLAYQIWKNACDIDPSLKKTIPDLPGVIFSTKALSAVPAKPAGAAGHQPTSGVMVYVRTADDNDALAWVDEEGRTVTESQHEILRAAACEPATPTLPRLSNHHPLVRTAVGGIQTEHITTGGQLGKPSSARRRVYERLKDYAAHVKDSLFDIKPLHQAIDEIYDSPLTEAARDLLNRELRAGVSDEKLVSLGLSLHEEDRLCIPKDDVEDLGWEPPASRKPRSDSAKECAYSLMPIARLSGIGVFEVTSAGGSIPEAKVRAAIHKQVSEHCYENLLIFTGADRTQSLWYWVKREGGKVRPREHLYLKGQPGDLFLSKLAAMVVDLSELDPDGNLPIVEAASRLKKALDIETVTKRFFTQFAEEHDRLLEDIDGIPDDHDRRWYASVILNRLMFIWFLQKKLFLDGGNASFLPDLLEASRQAGKNHFFSHTLRDLFFEGFAKLASKRACIGSVPLGDIPYLNGGLFLPHGIEARIKGDSLFSGPFAKIVIPDSAFADVFRLFSDYSWSLDDTPGGDDREINPGVLGCIFEKYINQKEFGAYYTRPEITEYLCEQTIHQLVLDAANKHAESAALLHKHGLKKGPAPRHFDTMSDLLLHADGTTCRLLLQEDLPRLSLLDPACGSGAFLVAAMKTLLGLITALIGRCEAIGEKAVLLWVEAEKKKHKAPLAYWVKKKIITENLYGVDIMEEAVEIAKLRLFLALVASAEKRDQLEPLPNIEFNLMPGNSLIGLLHVDPARYDQRTGAGRNGGGQERLSLLHEPGAGELGMTVESKTAPTRKEVVGAYLAKQRSARYEELLREKNRLVALYKSFDSWGGTGAKRGELKALTGLRDQIEAANRAAREILNKLLLDEFQGLGIQFEQATWDEKKQKEGKPVKRLLAISDIEALRPFHWAYEFDEIIVNRGDFDAIITNPPWENFKPDDKEFFMPLAKDVSKKKDAAGRLHQAQDRSPRHRPGGS